MGEFGIVTSPLNKDNNSLLRMIFLRLTDGIRDFPVIRLFYIVLAYEAVTISKIAEF
jgi:hypothetical protein